MIRWIINSRLGTGPAEQSSHADAVRIDVRHLLDAPGNDLASVANLIERGEKALRDGHTVLVLCDFGVSRSNAVAAGILAKHLSIPFFDATRQVIERTGETEIKVSIIETVRRALQDKQQSALNQKIAVTGASGTLGRAVIRELGSRAVALNGRDDFDLRGASALLVARLEAAAVSTVIHLAHPRIFSNNSALGEALHLQKNVMDAAAAIGATFVLVSCSAVFGKIPLVCRLRPDAGRRPSEIVGLIKSLQEELAECSEISRGPRTRIVRLPAVYGAGSPRPKFLRSFFDAIMAGRPVQTHRFAQGPAQLELLHIIDAAAGIVAVAERGKAMHYHLGNSHPIETAKLAELSSHILQRPFFHEEIRLEEAGFVPFLDWDATLAELNWAPQRDIEAELPAIIQAYKTPH